MIKSHYQSAQFLLSVAHLKQLPPDQGIEVAIIGRSNAGKSSVLNQLTHNKNLARVSKTPGRTQHINLFRLDENKRIADLPGYGYAKVPPAMREHWRQLLDTYLRTRECLKGLILVMDIRHPLREFDQQLLFWSSQSNLPVHILLNKADKLSFSAIKRTVADVNNQILAYANPVTVQTFSVLKSLGVKELQKKMDEWFYPLQGTKI